MEITSPTKITIFPLWEKVTSQTGILCGQITLSFLDSKSSYVISIQQSSSDEKFTRLRLKKTSRSDEDSSLRGLFATATQISNLALSIQAYNLVEDKTISINSTHPLYLKPITKINLSPLEESPSADKYYLVLSYNPDGSLSAEFKKIPERPASLL